MPISAKKHGPLWKRILAYFIDVVIIAIVLSPLPRIEFSFPFTLEWHAAKQLLYIFVVGSILTILYFALLEFYIGQTVGKAIFSIAAVSEGKSLQLSQALIRNALKFSSLLLLIDSLPVIFGRSNQRFFERISNTEVVIWEK